MPGYFSVKKHDRENRRDQRRAEKEARRQERKSLRVGSDRFPSAYPEAPEAYEGIARTLSRGLPE